MNFKQRIYLFHFLFLVFWVDSSAQTFKTQKNNLAEEKAPIVPAKPLQPAINPGVTLSPVDKSLLNIKWHNPVTFTKKGKNNSVLSFEGISYFEEKNFLPYIILKTACNQNVKMQAVIQPEKTEVLTAQEEQCVDKRYLTENFALVESKIVTYRKIPYTYVDLIPLRINKSTGKIEKLLSYRLQWQLTNESLSAAISNGAQASRTQSANYASTSVLATGTWYKIGTAKNAVYKIDKKMLQSIVGPNVDVSSIDPKNIKIYGNGGEILSEANYNFHYDDLIENAIFVQGQNDGVFNDGDYILFYGQSPHKWKYNAGNNSNTRYYRNKHYYSDSVFYFLNYDNPTAGKRIASQTNASGAVTNVVNSFDDFMYHENDLVSLVTSGRELYGENYDNTASYSFNFYFPNIENDTVWLRTDILGRRVQQSGTATLPPGAFDIVYPGAGNSYQVNFPTTGSSYDNDIGAPLSNSGVKSFVYTNATSNLPINISVNRTFSDETGWLNYIWVIARRSLIMNGSQMTFQDYRSIAPNAVSQFNLQSPLSTIRIWNISDQFNIAEQQLTYSANTYSFAATTDSLQQFIAFDGTSFETPAFVGKVANQNLHSLRNLEYVIVSYPGFTGSAQQVLSLHEQANNENLKGIVVTPDAIYNEFSSGIQDITAIRQFMRMLYTQSTVLPRYLLLYGTGSYLQKNRYDPSNTVYVPAFETYNSWSFTNSKTGDDFYALLDNNEGLISSDGVPDGIIDIGVGRLTVKNNAEAVAVANKISQYYNRQEPTSSCCDQATQNTPDWRNWVCLIADDANPDPTGNSNWEIGFLYQQESNAAMIQNNFRYNVDKIYEDAYLVEAVPGGRRYPDVNTAINNRVAQGALIIGYSGHGGELNLSHEEIVTIPQIAQWNNINNMPLFFTATCEFSRYDDPTIESAGEDILLNPQGAGIGLFTTTRLAYITDGNVLGPVFYPTALDTFVNGKRPTLGDIMRITKFSQPNYLHFALLGDPALTLSYPKQYTSPVQINNHMYVAGVMDTISALGKYKITGYISDVNGNKINNFNGTIYITVFDKPNQLVTLNNSQNTPNATFIVPFNLQKSVLFKGKSVVTNGDFNYTFIVPKDIMYNFGKGKISYYAQNDTSDAAGYYEQIMVGGSSNNPIVDNQGPVVKLYMNDDKFVSGGITNQNPFIYSVLTDSSGINTTGNGLGHDLVAILDANTAHEVVLNDYYQSDLNKYQSGKILYQLSSLTNGNHTLTLKVWDILDNASVSTTDFVVAQNAQIALSHVLNYPNPFTTSTRFYVEHNQSCDFLHIEVQIFTITGKIVKTINQTVENQGFRTDGINWDGRDDYGDKLGRGVYIYKVTVKNSEGNKADKMEKLVILN